MLAARPLLPIAMMLLLGAFVPTASADDCAEDLDGDGVPNCHDEDVDGDGYSDEQERAAGSDPRDRCSTPPDLDGDGLPNLMDDQLPDEWLPVPLPSPLEPVNEALRQVDPCRWA